MSDLAEQSVLSCCYQSPLALERASAILTAADFTNPDHAALWDVLRGLKAEGRPTDAMSVQVALAGNKRLIGVHLQVVTNPAVADSVEHHASEVHGVARRREVIRQAIRMRQRAEDPEVDPQTIVAETVNALTRIRDLGAPDIDTKTLGELMDTPDDPYDWVIPGLLERMDRLVITGEEGLGKALALDTPIPTPKGWTVMGALLPGDEVFAPDGTATVVLGATDVMHGRPCYRVTFSDDSQIVADGQHLWLTETLRAREALQKYARRPKVTKSRGTDQQHKRVHFPKVVTTAEIAETLMARNGHAVNHSVVTTLPLQYPEQDLLIDPYVLGAWLGDGTSRSAMITCHPDDGEILDRIRFAGWPVRKLNAPFSWAIGDGLGRGIPGDGTLQGRLRLLGLLQNKHIPEVYLRASVGQRLALLQGLMDTDGSITTAKAAPVCEFSVCSEPLALGVLDLLHGLGIKVKMASGPAKIKGRTVSVRYRLAFQTDLPVFHLKRKAERLKPLRTRRAQLRYITAVTPIDSVPVRCIQVEREDGLFVAGNACIPTHNSVFLRQLALMGAAGIHPFTRADMPPIKAHIIDLENTERHVKRQLRAMHLQAKTQGRDPSDRVVIDCRPGGIDICKDRDLSWVNRVLDASQPDLLVIGPLYKLAPRALQTDDHVAPVISALDSLRARGLTLVMEAHAGHAEGKDGRNMRPRGSAALMGWPEFGYGLRWNEMGDVDMVAWRGDRDERSWPLRIKRGGQWPWTPLNTQTSDEDWQNQMREFA